MNTPDTLAQDQKIRELIATHRDEAGALLPLLHAIQDALGYVPDASLSDIAKALNLSRAEVYGVLTYYHYFRRTPPAKHTLQICRAEACQARGANALISQIEQKLGCKMHERTIDGNLALEPIYCLGQCAVGPAMLVDDTTLYAHVNAATVDEIVSSLGAAK